MRLCWFQVGDVTLGAMRERWLINVFRDGDLWRYSVSRVEPLPHAKGLPAGNGLRFAGSGLSPTQEEAIRAAEALWGRLSDGGEG